MNILEKIIHYKQAEILGIDCKYKNQTPKKSARNFLKFLKNSGQGYPKLIAEIKIKSPSKGEIFPSADIKKIAKIYEKNGVSAISCLTDHHFFGGSCQSLKQVSKSTRIPILRKDFIFTKGQVKEARIYGANAILLMVSVLKRSEEIRKLRIYSESLGMHCLIETHDEEEIRIAVNAGAKIIGVNSRNFNDPKLKINLSNFQKLLPLIPDGIIRVAESGLKNFEEVEKISTLCDAILVGTNFMQLQNYEKIEKEVRKFTKK